MTDTMTGTMTDMPTDTDLARAFDYPYPRPRGSFLLTPRGWMPLAEPVRIVNQGAGARATSLDVRWQLGAKGMRSRNLVPVLASGSNAAPAQLRRKFGASHPPLLVLRARISGLMAVHSAHIARYGAVSATLMARAGLVGWFHVVLIPEDLLPMLDASEALGINYDRVLLALPALDLAGAQLARVHAYRSRHGVFAPHGAPLALKTLTSAPLVGRVTQHQALALAQAMPGVPPALKRLKPEDFVRAVCEDETMRRVVTDALAGFGVAGRAGAIDPPSMKCVQLLRIIALEPPRRRMP